MRENGIVVAQSLTRINLLLSFQASESPNLFAFLHLRFVRDRSSSLSESMELFVNYSTPSSCKQNLLNYFYTIGTLKWCMKCTVVDVFSVACSPERRKERDVSHVYRQWKMIVLLWLPSNRSESFVFLLIFPVSASMPLIPRDCAIIKDILRVTIRH